MNPDNTPACVVVVEKTEARRVEFLEGVEKEDLMVESMEDC